MKRDSVEGADLWLSASEGGERGCERSRPRAEGRSVQRSGGLGWPVARRAVRVAEVDRDHDDGAGL